MNLSQVPPFLQLQGMHWLPNVPSGHSVSGRQATTWAIKKKEKISWHSSWHLVPIVWFLFLPGLSVLFCWQSWLPKNDWSIRLLHYLFVQSTVDMQCSWSSVHHGKHTSVWIMEFDGAILAAYHKGDNASDCGVTCYFGQCLHDWDWIIMKLSLQVNLRALIGIIPGYDNYSTSICIPCVICCSVTMPTTVTACGLFRAHFCWTGSRRSTWHFLYLPMLALTQTWSWDEAKGSREVKENCTWIDNKVFR